MPVRRGAGGLIVPDSEDLGRAHTGPKPGTYLITVELPPGTDPDKWNALLKVCGNIAHKYIPGAYVHGSRVMEPSGKHRNGFAERPKSD